MHVANTNVVGSQCPGMMVVVQSCGMLMRVWWTKRGPWAGRVVPGVVPDVVRVANVVPPGSISM